LPTVVVVEGGFSGPKNKPDTDNSILPCHIKVR
jgi:hypothetical protein